MSATPSGPNPSGVAAQQGLRLFAGVRAGGMALIPFLCLLSALCARIHSFHHGGKELVQLPESLVTLCQPSRVAQCSVLFLVVYATS
jgi:hypothetical protein